MIMTTKLNISDRFWTLANFDSAIMQMETK